MNVREDLKKRFWYLYRNIYNLTDQELKRNTIMLIEELNLMLNIPEEEEKIDNIEGAVLDIFMLNREEIYTKKRLRPNVEARAAIYYYLREKTPLSFHKIANKYGKNHATVIHGAKLWGNLISTSKKYMQQNELIIKQINN